MTDEQRKSLHPKSLEYSLRVRGSKTQLIGWSLYTLLLWMLKLCMCHFYSRLTYVTLLVTDVVLTAYRSGLYQLQLRVKIGYYLIGATYIATELSILLGCQPFRHNWQIFPNPGSKHAESKHLSVLTTLSDFCQPAISKIDLYVTVILNVLTDMYLMSIPLPMLWKANLEFKRKLTLIFIFGGGVFVMMAGILRCALIIQDPINGAQAAGSWAVRETFVAVVIGNIPMIYPLTRRGVEKVYSMAGGSRLEQRSRSNGDQFDGDGLPLKSGPHKSARRGKNRNVQELPTTWYDESPIDGWESETSGSIRHLKSPSPGGKKGQVREDLGGIQVTRETILHSEPRNFCPFKMLK